MAPAKQKTALPAILLANDLLDGDVVFRSGHGWSRDPAEATVAADPDAAHALEELAAEALRRGEVVDAYLVDVTIAADGLPVPNHFRERFKISGPSIRRDLGKQAHYPHLRRS